MEFFWWDYILLVFGLFYALFPHSIHLAVARHFGYYKPINHGVHVTIGFTSLIIWLLLSRNRMDLQINNSLLIASCAGLLDTLFHFAYTEPFEDWFYFVVKMLLLVPLTYYLQSFPNISQNPTYYAMIGGLVFMAVFSIYYRINEFVKSQPFGERVPDINIFNQTITYSNNKFLSAIIWGCAHFLAYFMPAFLVFSLK